MGGRVQEARGSSASLTSWAVYCVLGLGDAQEAQNEADTIDGCT